MMKRPYALLLHIGVLLAASIFAYLAFTSREKEPSKGRVILDFEPQDLMRLEFSTPKKVVKVTPREGGGFTLKINEQIKKPAPEKKESKQKDEGKAEESGAVSPVDGKSDKKAGPAEKAGEKAKDKTKTKDKAIERPMITENKIDTYRASKQFEKYLGEMLPLYAERDLGTLDADKLAEFGLAESERTLTIEIGSQKVVYSVGKQTYGGATTYIRRLPDGPVYLVSASMMRRVDIRASRYMEYKLVEPASKDVDAVVVASEETKQSRRLEKIRTERRDRWVPADEPEATNTLFGTWVGKVFRLTTATYLEEDPVPPPLVKARIQFFERGKKADELILAAGQLQEGKKDYYARSAFTGQWVKLKAHGAQSVFEDIEAILQRE